MNSYNIQHIYKELAIDIKKLYCVMAYFRVGNIPHFRESDLYYSDNYSWIKGKVIANNAHITLLYGLLGDNIEHVREILKDYNLPQMVVNDYSYFDSPNDEEYYCIIGKVKITPAIMDAHYRLSLLPHINTFPEYKPHITLAYIKKDRKLLEEYLYLLNSFDFTFTWDLKLEFEKLVFDNNTNERTI